MAENSSRGRGLAIEAAAAQWGLEGERTPEAVRRAFLERVQANGFDYDDESIGRLRLLDGEPGETPSSARLVARGERAFLAGLETKEFGETWEFLFQRNKDRPRFESPLSNAWAEDIVAIYVPGDTNGRRNGFHYHSAPRTRWRGTANLNDIVVPDEPTPYRAPWWSFGSATETGADGSSEINQQRRIPRWLVVILIYVAIRAFVAMSGWMNDRRSTTPNLGNYGATGERYEKARRAAEEYVRSKYPRTNSPIPNKGVEAKRKEKRRNSDSASDWFPPMEKR